MTFTLVPPHHVAPLTYEWCRRSDAADRLAAYIGLLEPALADEALNLAAVHWGAGPLDHQAEGLVALEALRDMELEALARRQLALPFGGEA